MDGVLLKGRFIVSLAQRANKTAELAEYLDNYDLDPEERTQKIAALFAGIRREVFEQVARDMPLTRGASETIVGLRKAGFRVGLVTDSFLVAADIVRRRVFADFCFAHLMKFQHGKATGQVRLSPAMIHPHGCLRHPHCKANVMRHLMEKMEITAEQVLAVGDGMNDVCMLEEAGTSVAFHPTSPFVGGAAGYVVEGELSDVLAIIQAQTCDGPARAIAGSIMN
jgi:phosphoserine phosphatase